MGSPDRTEERGARARPLAWRNLPLRRRLVVTIALMLVPILAVVALARLTVESSNEFAHAYVEVGVEELGRVGQLERLTLEALSRAEHRSLLAFGGPEAETVRSIEESVLPERLRRVAARTFAELQALDSLSEAQRRELRAASDSWSALANVADELDDASRVTAPPLLRMVRGRTGEALADLRSVRQETEAKADRLSSSFRSTELRVQLLSAVVLLTAVVAVLVLGGALAATVLAPIRRLQAAADAWSDGDLGHRVHLAGRDELTALAGAMNTMAVRLQDQQRRLEEMARRDGLTGLVNRAELTRRLEEEARRSALEHRPVTFMLIDVDHFKAVNDRHGHQAGDEVLRAVGHMLRHEVRSADTVARFGGDELALLLPDTTEERGREIAERVRLTLAAHALQDRLGPITLSIGVATSRGALSPTALVAAADAALYGVKQSGRGHARSAPVPPVSPVPEVTRMA